MRLKNNNEETTMAPYSLSSVIVRLTDVICSCQGKSLNSHPVWSGYTSLTAPCRGCNIVSSQINLGSRAAPLAPYCLTCGCYFLCFKTLPQLFQLFSQIVWSSRNVLTRKLPPTFHWHGVEFIMTGCSFLAELLLLDLGVVETTLVMSLCLKHWMSTEYHSDCIR